MEQVEDKRNITLKNYNYYVNYFKLYLGTITSVTTHLDLKKAPTVGEQGLPTPTILLPEQKSIAHGNNRLVMRITLPGTLAYTHKYPSLFFTTPYTASYVTHTVDLLSITS